MHNSLHLFVFIFVPWQAFTFIFLFVERNVHTVIFTSVRHFNPIGEE